MSSRSLRAGFADLHAPGRQRVPLPEPPHPAGGADAWLPWERNDFGLWVRQQATKSGLRAEEVMSFDQFFRELFGRAPPPVLYGAQGAQLAASASARCALSVLVICPCMPRARPAAAGTASRLQARSRLMPWPGGSP